MEQSHPWAQEVEEDPLRSLPPITTTTIITTVTPHPQTPALVAATWHHTTRQTFNHLTFLPLSLQHTTTNTIRPLVQALRPPWNTSMTLTPKRSTHCTRVLHRPQLITIIS
uniref:Uncharacterized protein n=1 Tax=Cacopsylla melanoneura TaxID=428564 RepID=A0A8D8T9G4_9HEMI